MTKAQEIENKEAQEIEEEHPQTVAECPPIEEEEPRSPPKTEII